MTDQPITAMPAHQPNAFKPRSTINEALTAMLAPSHTCFDTATYLEEFAERYEKVVWAHETQLTSDLTSRGASEDLMHEWALMLAGMQDFMEALKVAIEEARSDG